MYLEVMFHAASCAAEMAEIGFFPGVGALVYIENAFIGVYFATDLIRGGIYYKFANMRLRRISPLSLFISPLSLFIRITCWWVIGL